MWKELVYKNVMEGVYLINEDGDIKFKDSKRRILMGDNKARLRVYDGVLKTQNIALMTSKIFGKYKGYTLIPYDVLNNRYGVNKYGEVIDFRFMQILEHTSENRVYLKSRKSIKSYSIHNIMIDTYDLDEYKGYKVIKHFDILNNFYGINEECEMVQFDHMKKVNPVDINYTDTVHIYSNRICQEKNKRVKVYRKVIELYNFYFNNSIDYEKKFIQLNFIYPDLSKIYLLDMESRSILVRKGKYYTYELKKSSDNRYTLIKENGKQIKITEFRLSKIIRTYKGMYSDLANDISDLSNRDLGIIIGIYIRNEIKYNVS